MSDPIKDACASPIAPLKVERAFWLAENIPNQVVREERLEFVEYR
jgi:hypothetical protein